jgi:hypothetical protein
MDMRGVRFRSCRLAAFSLFLLQSLADVAREEAERRKGLEQQGIEAKVIEGDITRLAPNGNLSTSTLPSPAPKKTKPSSDSGKSPSSIRSFRSALQKLDRTIRQDQERLDSRRARLQAEKWALPKVGPVSRGGGSADSQARLQVEIGELESKLKRMRRERSEIYEEGRRAGFLPGELDGKGIIP